MTRWGALALLGACTFVPSGGQDLFRSEPGGPCYDANLLDGFDDTDEIHVVFACINAEGALDSYASLDAALDGPTRDGPAGAVLLAWLDTFPAVDLSLPDLLDEVLAVLEAPEELLSGVRMGFELLYASPWADLGAATPLNSQVSLDAGVFVPLLPMAGLVAGTALDEDLASLAPLTELLRSATLRQIAWTAASVGASDNPALAPLGRRWATDAGDAIARTRDPANDRWSAASGDSLRDLAGQLFTRTGNDGRPVIEHLGDPLRPLLADDVVRDRMEAALEDQIRAGRLDSLPAELLYLASVDPDGGALADGEDSALVALVRLLHAGDTEVTCSVDLIVTSLDISLGNLSLELLQLFADADPDTLVSGVGLLGGLLGIDLTDSILDLIVDSRVCPAIDAQLVADLDAIDRFNDAGAGTSLYVLLAALDAIDAPTTRIPEVIDLIGTLDAFELVEPGEEALRDLHDAPLTDDLLAFLPALLDPWGYHDPDAFPPGIEPVSFADAWGMAEAVLEESDDGTTALGRVSSLLNIGLAQQGTWTAVGNLGRLLEQPDAETADALPWLTARLEADPDLEIAVTLADSLDDYAFVRAPLVLVEAEGLRGALGATQLTQPGPLPFTAVLVHDGTLDVLLDTLRLLVTLLPEDTP